MKFRFITFLFYLEIGMESILTSILNPKEQIFLNFPVIQK